MIPAFIRYLRETAEAAERNDERACDSLGDVIGGWGKESIALARSYADALEALELFSNPDAWTPTPREIGTIGVRAPVIAKAALASAQALAERAGVTA